MEEIIPHNRIEITEWRSVMGRPPRRSKYRSIRTNVDGKDFHSKLEARYYEKLLRQRSTGKIRYFLQQVPFILPGNIKYRVDFQVFKDDGSVEYIDCKGFPTPVSTLKIKQVEDLYPVSIKIISKV